MENNILEAKPKFNIEDVVVRQTRDGFELGVVADIYEELVTYKIHQRQDGLNGAPTGPEYTKVFYKYDVRFTQDKRVYLIDESLLTLVINTDSLPIDVNSPLGKKYKNAYWEIKEKLNAYWDSYNNDDDPDFMYVLEYISELLEVEL